MRTASSIELWLTDPGAAADASVSVTGSVTAWSDPADIPRDWLDGHIPTPATLEEDFGWPLDGSRDLMPDDPAAVDWGIWGGALETGETGRTVELVLAHPHGSDGITLEFPGALPAAARLRWYDGDGALLADETFTPEASLCFCEKLVEDYRRVTVDLSGLPAGRWFRLQSVLFGGLETIGGSRITRAMLTEDFDPTLTTLPISTLELSFYTEGGRFKMLTPSTAYRAFRRRQRADVYKEIDGDRRKIYTLYLAELKGTADAVTSLTFEDILGVLDRESFDGGIYENYPAARLLADMGFRYEIDGSLQDAAVSGHLPVQSVRESLRDLCFAVGARAETSAGFVRLVPETEETNAVIGADRRITGHSLKQEEPVTRTEVASHTWSLQTSRNGEEIEDGELPTLASGTFPVGRHRIELNNPGVWKEIRGGAWPVESHVNFIVLDVADETETEVEILGWEYQDAQAAAAAETEAPAGAFETQTRAVNAGALIGPDQAKAAADRLLAYYGRRYVDRGDLLPGWERAGDCVVLDTPWGGKIRGWIEHLVTDLYGGCIQTADVRGERTE